MLRWLSLAGLLLAGCVESLSPLDAGIGPDAATTDTGPSDGALEDAGAVIATLSIVHADGEAAGGSLVYELNGRQGRLLGRADTQGQFLLRTMPERLLVRHAFDEVQVFSPSFEDQTVTLDPVTDHPETLDMRGVGLEFRVLRSDQIYISFLPAGDRLFAVRDLGRSTSQVVEIDIDVGTEREILRSDASGEQVFNTTLRRIAPNLLVIADETGTHVLEASKIRFSVLDLNRETVIGPTPWTSGYSGVRTVDTIVENGSVHLVVLSPAYDEFELTHHRFRLVENRVVEGGLQKFGSPRACQLYPGQLFFQQEDRLWKYDIDTSTLTPQLLPEIGSYNCQGTWPGRRGLTTHHVENGEFILSSEQGDLLRQPVSWPPSGEAWFVGAGDAMGQPFVTTGVVTTNDFRGFLVVPDPVEASVALLDIESLFGRSVQIWGPAYPVGDRYVALIAEDGPTQPPYQRLFMNRDGSGLQLEPIDLRPGCRPFEAGPFTAWPREVSLMNCSVGDREFAIFSDGQDTLKRTFYGITQGEAVVAWDNLRLYQSGEGDEAGIFAFDTEAPR